MRTKLCGGFRFGFVDGGGADREHRVPVSDGKRAVADVFLACNFLIGANRQHGEARSPTP